MDDLELAVGAEVAGRAWRAGKAGSTALAARPRREGMR
jgi:hypothetical protein